MKDGYIKVAAASPKLKVADCIYNCGQILEDIVRAEALGVKLLVFPELSVSGYTCGDLFLQDVLLSGCEKEFSKLLAETKEMDILFVVGLPVAYRNKLYNVAAFC